MKYNHISIVKLLSIVKFKFNFHERLTIFMYKNKYLLYKH